MRRNRNGTSTNIETTSMRNSQPDALEIKPPGLEVEDELLVVGVSVVVVNDEPVVLVVGVVVGVVVLEQEGKGSTFPNG